jgi:hypothetical protein
MGHGVRAAVPLGPGHGPTSDMSGW